MGAVRDPGRVDPTNPVDHRHPLNRGLVSWWLPLPGRLGNTLYDLAGRNHGVLTNGPTWTAGPTGFPALATDGVNDYVSVAGGGGLDGVTAGTLVVAVRWTSSSQDPGFNASVYGPVTGRQNNGAWANHVLGLNGADPATAKVQYSAVSFAGGVLGATSPGVRRDRHIVCTYRPSAQALYLDGVLDGTATQGGAVSSSAAIPLTIGAWIGDGNGYATAVIHEVRTYNRELSAAEAAALCAEWRAGNPTTLRRWSRRAYLFAAGASLPAFSPHWARHSNQFLGPGVLSC